MSQSALNEASAAHAAWRRERQVAVTAPQGNLALVETRWLDDGERPDLDAARAGAPESVSVTTLRRSDITTGEDEHGLRFWDSESDGIKAFDTITCFEYDPDWVVEATFTPVDDTRTVPFEHIRDNGGSRELAVPGDITFERDGVEYRFAAFDDGGVLLLVFGDATNALTDDTGTYGAGRFLFVARPEGATFDEPGSVTLDFNRAFVPPCGFSEEYNCPLPPAQNRFAGPVLAGEKRVLMTEEI